MNLRATRTFQPYLSVHASAGSGKTHQLVNRLIYLLLHGAEPGGILAITFTRKAAAEMNQRLLQRVRELSCSEEEKLEQLFDELQISLTPELRRRAAGLYESLLYSDYPVRSTTFHAFCQDLLRRFPMEADVPPGFELIEMTRQLLDEAWDNFSSDLTQNPSNELAQAMDLLLRKLGLYETKRVLFEFVGHRSDWWALTISQDNPLNYVNNIINKQLATDMTNNPRLAFLSDLSNRKELSEFHSLLLKQPGKYNNDSADNIEFALQEKNNLDSRFESVWLAFFTKDKQTPRSREIKPSVIKKLGENGAQRFAALHSNFCERLIDIRRQQHAVDTLLLSQAWMRCGDSFLSHFQRIKQNQRVLDFSDLEWKSYLLLTTASHADWVQYKLDQRIDHLLIDEFQDTNPIQWQLILPLLHELAAGETDRERSVLFVGDSKQSIYSFRRAEPRLFDTASTWLTQNLAGAEKTSLSKSWRSSPAVMNFVNRVFQDNPELPLNHFNSHETEHTQLYGRVSLLPLVAKDKMENNVKLRNPLTTPRVLSDTAHYHEGQRIAATINELINNKTVVGRAGNTRYLRYSDIMILFRSRTRVNDYERALREARIPYLGTERGTLLDSLEVRDMINLLQWLITPFNNLALAGILRSPLFAASDQDLMQLAGKPDWFSSLLELSLSLEHDHPLARAARSLQTWKPLADRLPVHDLLDRIYSEANIFARYQAAFPVHLHPRLIANLIRFLELALETDSGRYPSLTRFMVWLEQLRQQDKEAPDQPPGQGEQDRVRLLTVHEAKGLEAPVVFVADTSRESPADRGVQVLIEWPAEAMSPQTFLLSPASKYPNNFCEKISSDLKKKHEQENANLLYVALTRAEQYLYISASNKTKGWYEDICQVYGVGEEAQQSTQCLCEAGLPPQLPVEKTDLHRADIEIHPGLNKHIEITMAQQEIAPSYTIDWQSGQQSIFDEDARERGVIIHTMLEKLAQDPGLQLHPLRHLFAQVSDQQLENYWHEAQEVLSHFTDLFDTNRYEKAYNEVPLVYLDNNKTIHGIIDRLIQYGDHVLIVDYKTHRLKHGDDLELAAQPYQQQLHLYAEGIRRLYPDKPVHCQVLFTSLPQCVEVST